MVSLGDLMLPGPHVLKEGECYFDLAFHEREFRFPCVDSYVYIGTERLKFYFQDVESYLRYGNLLKRPSSRWPKKHGVVRMAADVVDHMFDLRGVAEALARLAQDAARSAPSN
jgi:hypothetical protein